MSPAWIDGSVMVNVIGLLAVGDMPLGASHATAKEISYDWPAENFPRSCAGFLMEKRPTVVPLGKAPGGTVTSALALPAPLVRDPSPLPLP